MRLFRGDSDRLRRRADPGLQALYGGPARTAVLLAVTPSVEEGGGRTIRKPRPTADGLRALTPQLHILFILAESLFSEWGEVFPVQRAL
jgi:hypothetical protein